MNECSGTGPYIDPPAPKGQKERLMEILGVEEVEISMTNEQGEETTAIVLGRMADS